MGQHAAEPANAEQIREALLDAAAAGERVRVIGGDTKRPMVLCSTAQRALRTTGIAGITNYEPEELVLSLRAGTPMADVKQVLAARGQMLAFDPPDYAAVLGTAPASSTIGGVLGSGFAGSRRVSAGNVRDHILGFDAVSGRGEIFRAGGRVIKNVTGYDLAKLMVGSWGTLAVLTEVTLRVLPSPPYEASLLFTSDNTAAALGVLRTALATAMEVSCAALLPDGRGVLRLEGFQASVDERARQLRLLFAKHGSLALIEQHESAALWKSVRDVTAFAAGDARALWRLSVPATAAADVFASISSHGACDALFDWGGSLVWIAVSDGVSPEHVRNEVRRVGGHAWSMRASARHERLAASAPPQDAGIAALSERVRLGFDPQQVFANGPF